MKFQHSIKKTLMAVLLVMGIQAAYAAFSLTGLTDDKNKTTKYSLKNLGSLSHKGLSFSSLKSSLQYKGTQLSKESSNNAEVSSMLRFDNGNTTYVYPYKFKVKAPKFKTPVPTQN